ncbi:hypothetical protein [Shivajiella indica]|uniref:Outer membrane protein beta-barrel domain-containing protein n=1 Tax=Shivajiella indica TaxID=872115 RepID=A0ABW5B934_9BACT
MKTYIYLLTFSLVTFLGLNESLGQGNLIMINYAPTLPLGNTADFTSNFTGRGGNFEFYWMRSNQLGIGVEIGSVSFKDKIPDRTFSSGTVTITGTQFRGQASTPILVSAMYILTDKGKLKPYVSIGAGIMQNTQRIDLGIFVQQVSSRHFAFKPELGAIYQISDYVGIKLSGKYYQSVGNNTIDSQSMLGINLGFVMINFNN